MTTETNEPRKRTGVRGGKQIGAKPAMRLMLTSRAKMGAARKAKAEPTVTKLPTRTVEGGGSKQRKTAVAKQPVDLQQAAAKAERRNPPRAKGDFYNDQPISTVKAPEDQELATRWRLIKPDMTVGDLLQAQKDKGLRQRRPTIRKLIQGGYITLATPSQGGSSGGNRAKRAAKRTTSK